MPSAIRNITADSVDPWTIAQFWSAALNLPIHPDNEPGDDEVGIPLAADDHAHGELIFQLVPEAKTVKNRFHLCLEPDTGRAQEVERLTALGARVVVDRTTPDGGGWFVLADPEGNEFCVLRSEAERNAHSRGRDTGAMADDIDPTSQQLAATHAAASQFAARLVGLTRAEATELASAEPGFDVQFLAEGTMVTLDFRPARIRATVADDRVVSATAG